MSGLAQDLLRPPLRIGRRGVRTFGGRQFVLAGRGSKESCQREARSLRRYWRYVRIVPARPFDSRAMRAALDDFMVYVFEEIAR